MTAPTRLWVSMGMRANAQAPLRPRLREVDLRTGAILRELTYEVQPEHSASPQAHQEFTAASILADGRVLQPAHTELLWIDPRKWAVERMVSHPLFHGVHSATESADGSLVLTCAGTESVLELDARGRLVRHRWLRPGPFDYGPITDFRRLDHDRLKPHSHHPNFAARVGEELWVTCFETSACHGLDSGRHIPLPEAIPHDGRLRDGRLWFTQITGRIVAVDPRTLERVVEIDLAALAPQAGALGWCRGVEVVGSRLFVGMTMLRATRHREVLRQLVRGPKRPTRVVEIDLDGPRIVREIPVGNEAGGTIYSVLADRPSPL